MRSEREETQKRTEEEKSYYHKNPSHVAIAGFPCTRKHHRPPLQRIADIWKAPNSRLLALQMRGKLIVNEKL